LQTGATAGSEVSCRLSAFAFSRMMMKSRKLIAAPMDFSTFQILTFDCYGTMINWESGILSALRPILAANGKQLTDARVLEIYSELEPRNQQGEFRPYREVLTSVVRGFGEKLGFVPSETEARSLPDSVADWNPFPDTVEALHRLKTRFQLAVISNVDD